MSEDKEVTRVTVFGYPLKDWIIILGLFTTVAGGAFTIGGTPNQTTEAIETQTGTIEMQTSAIVRDLREIRATLDSNGRMARSNADRIDDLERAMDSRLDSIQTTMIQGLKNLDGYFRGRLDQIKDN